MSQTDSTNRQWLLSERPKGEPTERTLRMEECPIPKAGAAQMLLRTEFLSLDP